MMKHRANSGTDVKGPCSSQSGHRVKEQGREGGGNLREVRGANEGVGEKREGEGM